MFLLLEPCKSSQFRALCIVSTQLSKPFWIWAQMAGTCATWRRVLWSNMNVEGKSDWYFLFYWPANITYWTVLVHTKVIAQCGLDNWFLILNRGGCVRVMPHVDCSTDHKLLCSKVTFTFEQPPKRNCSCTKDSLCDRSRAWRAVEAVEDSHDWTTDIVAGLLTGKHQDWFDEVKTHGQTPGLHLAGIDW